LNISFISAPTQLELHNVNIYFSSPTFDKITKDQRANFETKLSAIGGTMGLFTGFSILSGVEIFYFLFKIFFQRLKGNKTKNKQLKTENDETDETDETDEHQC
jgi:hypothetical protein